MTASPNYNNMIELVMVLPFNRKYYKVYVNSLDDDPHFYTHDEIYKFLIEIDKSQLMEFKRLLLEFYNFVYYTPLKQIIIMKNTDDPQLYIKELLKNMEKGKKEQGEKSKDPTKKISNFFKSLSTKDLFKK